MKFNSHYIHDAKKQFNEVKDKLEELSDKLIIANELEGFNLNNLNESDTNTNIKINPYDGFVNRFPFPT